MPLHEDQQHTGTLVEPSFEALVLGQLQINCGLLLCAQQASLKVSLRLPSPSHSLMNVPNENILYPFLCPWSVLTKGIIQLFSRSPSLQVSSLKI